MNLKTPIAAILLLAMFVMPIMTHAASDASGEVITQFKDSAQFGAKPTGEASPPVQEAWIMIVIGGGIVGLAGWGRRKFRKL